ncbi:MAG: PDZ domain-containing protein [Candidatus Omnitrophota bacterium]
MTSWLKRVAARKSLIFWQSFIILAGNYSSIYQRDLFQLTPPPPAIEVKTIVREPLLTEILTLKGTVILEGSLPLAIIEDRRSKTETIYPEGGTVAGAKVVKVEQYRITLLDKEGKEVNLFLSSVNEPSSSISITGKPAIEISGAPSGPEQSKPAEETKVPEILSVSLTAARQSVNQNYEEIKKLRIAPVVTEGKVTGYRVKNIEPNSLASRYGFQNGDVVTKVNGSPLESLSRLSNIYRSMEPGKPVSVEVVRAGQPITLLFQVLP